MQMNNFGSTLIDRTTRAPKKDIPEMKKLRILVLIAALFLSSVLFVPHARAQSHLPLSQNCTAVCTQYGWWYGTTYGFYTQFQASNPTFNNSSGYWTQEASLRTKAVGSGSLDGSIQIGLEKEKTTGFGYCADQSSQYPEFYVVAYNDSGTKTPIICYVLGSQYVNHFVQISIADSPNDQGYDFVVTSPGLPQIAAGTVFWSDEGGHTSFPYITFIDQFQDNVGNGQHWQWGTQWLGNSWVTSGLQFAAQTHGFSGTKTDNGPPPAMYWQTVPAPGNGGGELRTCIYDTTSNDPPCIVNG